MRVADCFEVSPHRPPAARIGQPSAPGELDPAILFEMFAGTPLEGIPSLFGPGVPVVAEAPLLDRVIGLTGRDPAWQAG